MWCSVAVSATLQAAKNSPIKVFLSLLMGMGDSGLGQNGDQKQYTLLIFFLFLGVSAVMENTIGTILLLSMSETAIKTFTCW